ncbi:pickpocket protein 28 [Leguminivora glycinivorella]|uniref:pickpocket protein 28 n=1 Tax=Leguminivora glycinivorella TaxID=1035111 RepID=UPI00200C5040|nr:pickpocket protein 28 [Leguminivora glycinivorella]
MFMNEERPPQPHQDIISGCDGKTVRKDLREYLLTSTLHGLRYVGEKKLTWFERFFWLGAFSCSIVCAGFFILNVYDKWRSSPMIVSINPENMALQNLPFPAITVCNVNQAKKSVAERYKSDGDPVNKKLLESLCTTQEDTEIFVSDVAQSADWDYFRSFLINVTQPCSEMLAMCIWDSGEMSCQDLFNAQLTDEGLCCTFNVVHRNKLFRNPKELNDMNITFPLTPVDWTPEGGYPADAPFNGFPWRPRGIGTDHGLTLVLDANVAEYYCASTKSPSFKILLHNPTETPNIANLGDIYGLGIEARIAIQPRIMDAAPSLRGIDISKRVCLFSSEKNLVFYRTYTLNNCEMECEARNMLALCRCVLYYMPSRQLSCEECLPACTEISYSERMSSARLSPEMVKQYAKRLSGNKTAEYVTKNMLIIHFYFEDRTFTRFTKGEIFGLTEFLSNTGGLLGLCMGFSMMSLVELIYYVTLRALCHPRRRPKHHFTQ